VAATATTAAGRPGRPSSGARERLLEAGLEVLKAEGYAGASIAKVAARAGENKALVAYHFGSKQGLVAAVARELGEMITDEVVSAIGAARTPDGVIRGVADGTQRVLERDPRLARLYFDLSAVSVVEDEVRSVLREVKDLWRRTLTEFLDEAGVPARERKPAVLLVMAGIEGLALEHIERGETPELRRARALFVRVATDAIAGGRG
jgi:TetR/AcrR family transcriptional repressor of bet genes